MKKRTLKQQAKYAEKIILEENKDFYDDFIEKNYPKKKQKVRPVLISAGSALATILTLVLCLVFLLPSAEVPPGTGKNYLLENETTIPSNVIELNSDLQGIKLEIDTGYGSQIHRVYDSESNDTLYYMVVLTGELETIKINFYINSDYENKNSITEISKPTSVGGFNLLYDENIIVQDDIIFIFTYTATTEYNGTSIFIEYEETSIEEQSNFFKFFEQTIKKI